MRNKILFLEITQFYTYERDIWVKKKFQIISVKFLRLFSDYMVEFSFFS